MTTNYIPSNTCGQWELEPCYIYMYMYITQGLPETLPIKESLSLNNDIQMKYMYMFNGPELNLKEEGGEGKGDPL